MGIKFTAEEAIQAIKGSGGIVTTIADRLGCAWGTARTYIDNHPTVLQAYNDETERMLDMDEAVLFKSIKEGNTADAKWHLSRKGKHRGYAERIEQDHNPDGKPLEIGVTPVEYRTAIAPLAPRPVSDSDAPGENEDTRDGSQVG